jgi:hypothetical protein
MMLSTGQNEWDLMLEANDQHWVTGWSTQYSNQPIALCELDQIHQRMRVKLQ